MLRSQSRLNGRSSEKSFVRSETWAVAVALAGTVVALIYVFQLWDLNPRVPILYSGDGLLTLNGLRNMKFGDWYWSTDKLGAPLGQDLHDFPAVADNLHLIILWAGVKLLRDEVLTFNLYFFGSYLLTTLGGYIGARMLRLNRPAAVLVGITYSFLPYHYLQGPGHLYLAAYWAVPLWVAFLVRELMGDSLSTTLPQSMSPRSLITWGRQRETWLIFVISIMAASTGLYYAFFFLILATFVLAIRRATQTSAFQWIPITAALFVSVGVMALQYLPIWLYQRNNGNNLSIVERTVAAVEFYSLKISNMILPIAGHRIPIFSSLRDRSNPAYLIGEGSEALGFLGSVGLVALIVIAVYRLFREKDALTTALSAFTVIAVLLCTVGGLAQVIAVLGFTQLRVWSRMSVVIAFPAIVYGVSLILIVLRKRNQIVIISSLTFLGALSILDTNAGQQLPSYKDTARQWELDRDLVQQVENIIGKDAMIFQLPIIPFPENPPVVNMTDYEHLRGYLHSSTLRWSYGGVKGRSADWQNSLDIDPVSLPMKLRDMGYKAIWIDRNGYSDGGTELLTAFQNQGFTMLMQSQFTFVVGISK